MKSGRSGTAKNEQYRFCVEKKGMPSCGSKKEQNT